MYMTKGVIMKEVISSVMINAPKEKVWNVLVDIDNATSNISAITNVDIVDRPSSGVVGLKWKETREMFGKPTTEEMWISAADKPNSYDVSSDSHGMKYLTRFELNDADGGTEVKMIFGGEAVSLGAKIMAPLMGFMSGTLKKQLDQDLDDIKAASEA